MREKIFPSVIGLGYVGLPVFLRLHASFQTIGYDISNSRINELKKYQDKNNEFVKKDLKLKNRSRFTNDQRELSKSNFYIVTVPTPINKKNVPDLDALKKASYIISLKLKKNDIVVYESTVYPGTTKALVKNFLEKFSKLKENRDFFVCYSPERVNPGDKKHSINKIKKVIAISSNKKEIRERVTKVYKKITKKLVTTNYIEEAESAKVIENIQRDLNIALMNDVLIFSKKMKYNFNEIIRLASSKWNFLNFNPGLVGGHCLPVDPYYLYHIAKKNKVELKTLLAGRKVNNSMEKFVFKNIKKKIIQLKKNNNNPKILLCGLTYKANVSDIRNSLALNIFINLKNFFKDVIDGYDYVLEKNIQKRYKILDRINKKKKYNLAIFLTDHKKNKKLFFSLKKQGTEVYDPFNRY